MRIWVLICLSFLIGDITLAGNNKWTTGGPFGGSFQSFTFHPLDSNVVFAGGHGLFRSSNAGRTWKRLDLVGPSLVRIHPKQPDILIAAGRFSSIFRSPDLGDTWEEISSSPSEGAGLEDLEFHSKNPQIIYGISRKDFVKSTDGGRSWARKNSGIKFKPVCDVCGDNPRIEINPVNPDIVYALSVNRRIYKTTNGGESWRPSDNGLRLFQAHSLVVNPKNPKVLYAGTGEGGNVYKSTDGGSSWFPLSCPCRGAEGLAIDARDPSQLYTVGGAVAKSTDAGQSWKELSGPLLFSGPGFLGVGIHPSENIVLVGRHGLGILRSTSGGKVWQQTNSRLTSPFLVHLTADPGRSGHLYALGDNGISFFETRSSGRRWALPNLVPDVGNVFNVAIHPRNSSLIVAGIGGGVAVSTDQGKTWTIRNFNLEDSSEAELIAMHPADAKTIYVFAEGIGMVKSTDQGVSWKLINRGLSDLRIRALAVDPKDGSTLLAGTGSGKVFRTINGGRNWKPSNAGLGLTVVLAFSFDPENSKVIYTAGIGGIFRSINGARSWQRIESLPADFSFVEVDPLDSKTIFAGGPFGLFLSTDGSENWSAFDTNGLDALGLSGFVFSPWERESFFVTGFSGVFSFKRTAPENSPVIEQLIPAAAKVGDEIVIKGRSFGAPQGNSSISFAGADASTTISWSDAQVEIEVPSGARTGGVTVTVGGRESNPHEFILLPASGNIEPTSGSASGGTRVAIVAPPEVLGTQYNVLFGSVLATNVGFTAPNVITCIAPPGSGTVDVSVATSSASVSLGAFTYQ